MCVCVCVCVHVYMCVCVCVCVHDDDLFFTVFLLCSQYVCVFNRSFYGHFYCNFVTGVLA